MAKKTFESALQRLEAITEEMENGELSLESSLKKFDEGIKLAQFCNAQLEDAKEKIEMLIDKGDHIESEPYQEKNSEYKDLSE